MQIPVQYTVRYTGIHNCPTPELNYAGQFSVGRRGIVVIDCDCYPGDCGLIPTHGDSRRFKRMNLLPGQPMPCEGNWVVSPRGADWNLNVKTVSTIVAPSGNNYRWFGLSELATQNIPK